MTDITQLSSKHIDKLSRLIKEKEALQAKIEKIEEELSNIFEEKKEVFSEKRRGRKPKDSAKVKSGPATRSKRGRRGSLKENILELLQKSGAEGISVKDIAKQLKVKSPNVYSWFYTTGKTIKGLKRVGPGKYAILS